VTCAAEVMDFEGLGGKGFTYLNVAPDPVDKKRSAAGVSFNKAGVFESDNFQ
jgi:hypothetical protein